MKTLLLGVLAVLLPTGFAPALSQTAEQIVQINGKMFSPDRLEIKVGDKVTWKNFDLMEHTVTAQAKPARPEAQGLQLFDSGPLRPGDSFGYTFKKEGTYEYFCKNHKGMTGVVVVNPSK